MGERSGDAPAVRPGGRLAGLDGLRAVAVLSVMAFHFGSTWLPGGFLGVDIFYVLSGFLITNLLLQEWRRTGGIRLARFWGRRARRLLPGLLLVLLAVTWYVQFVAPPGSYPGYRMDAFSTLFYFSNWHQIALSTNYFVETGLVSPLTHCWSLAIEEQFYLIWPLLTILFLRAFQDISRATKALFYVSVLGATASAIEMAVLFPTGVNTTRMYFGTDTHAQCILIGAALACRLGLALDGSWDGGRSDTLPKRLGHIVDAVVLVGLGSLVVMAHFLTGSSAFTYQGGFLLAAIATAAVILAVVTVPHGAIGRLLSLQPLPWLGRISYGMYLWHFPLFVFLSPGRTGLTGLDLFVVRLVVTVAISATSFYAVERPILDGTFWRSARALIPAGTSVAAVSVLIMAATVGADATAATNIHYRSATLASSPPPAGSSVVVLGDSMALNLYYALTTTAPDRIRVSNGALFGCGLVVATGISNAPPTLQLTSPPACNSATPANLRWPSLDTSAVAKTRPGDLVVFVAGHDDTQDTLQNGSWTSILSATSQNAERAGLQRLVLLATAHGAHLDLFTLPCTEINHAVGGPLSSTDSPQRRAIYNRLLRAVAAANPASVSVIDYGSMLCPSGRFTEDVDGIQVRAIDGIHTPAYVPGNSFAGTTNAAVAFRFYSWLAPRLWPQLIPSLGH